MVTRIARKPVLIAANGQECWPNVLEPGRHGIDCTGIAGKKVTKDGLEPTKLAYSGNPQRASSTSETHEMRSSLPNPCLLETEPLPILDLADFARREGRRPRAIYGGHKWFARRLGAVFRALLVGATSEANADFWDLYYGKADLRKVVVLDPFVGGGTSAVEALRLGATVHAVDVDPVACAVSSFEARAGEMPDLSAVLDELKRTVGEKIRRFHVTKNPDGVERVVLHHFWVQEVQCGHCDHVFRAHPDYSLGEDGDHRWVICSHCGEVHRKHRRHEKFQCNTCGRRTRVDDGNVIHGVAQCPRCRKRRPLIDNGRQSEAPPTWRLCALEVLEEPNGRRCVPIARRQFVKAGEDDIELFKAAAEALRARMPSHANFLPQRDSISQDRTDSRLIAYGYRRWTDLFNARQLLHLSLLAEAISACEATVRDELAIAFSSHLTTNCMMAGYTGKWRRLMPLFSVRAFRHIPRPVELNPWCDGTGRGTFPNTVRKLMRAAEFAHNPREPAREGGFRDVASRKPAQRANVVCGTARDLRFLRKGTVDLVLTDPPYLDNIPYSELAEFFRPWLDLLKVVDDPQAGKRISMESLIGQRNDAESVGKYAQALGQAFAEVGRVLKTGGLLVFSFRHTSAQAWKALAEGLTHSRLLVRSIMPVPGEAGVGLHAHAGTGLWDAVFVMRKEGKARSKSRLQLSGEQMEEAKQQASEWAGTLRDSALTWCAADELTLFRAYVVGRALDPHASRSATAGIPMESALRAASWTGED